ncbi:Pls/PosA family non-ribosomal peptide synthetase, partial [Actinomycetospora atypica]
MGPTTVVPTRVVSTGSTRRDTAPRDPHDDRLDRVVERRCDEFRREGRAHHTAVEVGGASVGSLSYVALDAGATRLARYLGRRRFGAGDRIAVLLERPADALTAQLAIARTGAAWVPLDHGLPDAALAAVVHASGAGVVLTTADQAPRLRVTDVDAVYLDRVAAHVDAEDAQRWRAAERGPVGDAPAYIVVHAGGGDGRSSGSAGLRAPAIEHAAVTHLVHVLGDLFRLSATDRVFHDPRSGSDRAVLETWVPWSCGATVVTPAPGEHLRGPALGTFLRTTRTTVLVADPATLEGVDEELPDLRLLVLLGPERPAATVTRWQAPGRRILGLHGTPETTVVAFWTELSPDGGSTLGRPLPGHDVVLLDPADPGRAVPPGRVGEIGIVGPGVASGYVGRPDLADEAFVPIPGQPSRRTFRTGDLGRFTADRELEYAGRLEGAAGRGLRGRPVDATAPRRTRRSDTPGRTAVLPLPPESVGSTRVAGRNGTAAAEDPVTDVVAAGERDDAVALTVAHRLSPRPRYTAAPRVAVPPVPATPAPKDTAAPTVAVPPVPATPAPKDTAAPTVAVPPVPATPAPKDTAAPTVAVPPVPATPAPKDTAAPTVALSPTPARPGAGLAPTRPPGTAGRPTAGAPAAAAPDTGAPSTAVRTALGTILAEVLDRAEVADDADFFTDLGADSLLMARFCARIRKHPDLPSAAMQDIYQHRTLAGLAAALAPAPQAPDVAGAARVRAGLAATLAEVLGRSDVPGDADFFRDLGADSLLMARFCARLRKRDDLPSVAMPDVYRHSTLATLAASLASDADAIDADGPSETDEVDTGTDSAGADPTRSRAGTAAFVLCGAAQFLCFLAYGYLFALVLTWAVTWVTVATTPLATYGRAVVAGAVGLGAFTALPVVAKWVIVGRWRPGSIPVWSAAYLRFWVVKTLLRSSPARLFAGTPLQTLHLRALGARIGRGVVFLGPQTPVCTDLFSAGDGALIRKDAVVACYRAHDGRVEIGGVSLGAHAVVGESTVLDVRTAMGDGSSLAHSSSLHAGQAVPAGENWHGSPARRADAPMPPVPPAGDATPRRTLYTLGVLAVVLGLLLPAALLAFVLLHTLVPHFAELFEPPPGALADPWFYLRTLLLSGALYLGAIVVGLVVVATLPRLFALGLRPDTVYPLYGPRYWLHRAVGRLTNVKAFVTLFGDASAIAHYLTLLGYRLRPLQQTGSNFGMAVKHENPFLTIVGAGTVVADGLSVMNAEYSATSFRVSATRIGANNFLGNRIAYPPQGRTGDDCLLATKVQIPQHGPIRSGVGLLGSPSFEIPRTVARDSELDVTDPAELAASLRRKNRHNVVSMGLHLLVRWLFTFLLAVAVAAVGSLPVAAGAAEVVVVEVAGLVLLAGWYALVERCVRPLMARVPQGCSIYDPTFWRHERYWKVPAPEWVQIANGTPFKPLIWRLLGVRVGARVFDDGVSITERSFTTIGDEVTLGEGTIVQCHSQEDGGFKSDHVVIGARCTLGVGSFVHYGTSIGDGAVLAPDTFLMKGEEVPPGEHWSGNPARGTRRSPAPARPAARAPAPAPAAAPAATPAR